MLGFYSTGWYFCYNLCKSADMKLILGWGKPLVTNSNFIILISLQPGLVDLRKFGWWILIDEYEWYSLNN